MPSPLVIPPELKKITQFIRRAEELDRDVKRPESRLVAYYCRQYAVCVGITLSKSGDATKCLGEILTALESEKEAMSVFSTEESRLICRNFALDVFDKADAQDRSGNTGKNTAKTFYAAAVFLEILQHFNETKENEDEELGEKSEMEVEEDKKRIYSKWKATEILKAIKEGREIVPGGYQSNASKQDQSSNDGSDASSNEDILPPSAPSSNLDINQPTTKFNSNDDDAPLDQGTEVDIYGPPPEPPPNRTPSPPPYDPTQYSKHGNDKDNENDDDDENYHQHNDTSRPPFPSAIPPPSDSPQRPSKSSVFGGFHSKKGNRSNQKRSKEVMEDAIELTRFALAALQNNDADLGVTRLEQALEILYK